MLHFMVGKRGRLGHGGNKYRTSVSGPMCDSSWQNLIPSLWMISSPEKHRASSSGGAAVRNQGDQPEIMRISVGP